MSRLLILTAWENPFVIGLFYCTTEYLRKREKCDSYSVTFYYRLNSKEISNILTVVTIYHVTLTHLTRCTFIYFFVMHWTKTLQNYIKILTRKTIHRGVCHRQRSSYGVQKCKVIRRGRYTMVDYNQRLMAHTLDFSHT